MFRQVVESTNSGEQCEIIVNRSSDFFGGNLEEKKPEIQLFGAVIAESKAETSSSSAGAQPSAEANNKHKTVKLV